MLLSLVTIRNTEGRMWNGKVNPSNPQRKAMAEKNLSAFKRLGYHQPLYLICRMSKEEIEFRLVSEQK